MPRRRHRENAATRHRAHIPAAPRTLVVGVVVSALLAALLAIAAGATAARAQALDADDPDIDGGQTGAKSVNVFNPRLPATGAGHPRNAHMLQIEHAPADWLKLNAHIEIQRTDADGWLADHVALGALLGLRKTPQAGGIGLAWSTTLQLSADATTTNALVFGPVIKASAGDTALILNSFLEKTFGRNAEPGIAFTYGWQARHRLREGLAIGIEGFGTVDNIANAPPIAEQDHRIGPAVFFEWQGAESRTTTLDLGILAGITDAAPDLSLKATLGTSF